MKVIVAVLALALPLITVAEQRPQVQQQQANNGRYVIVFSPYARMDTYLLDTQTGAIWKPVTYSDVVGEPEVWVRARRIDIPEPLTPKAGEDFGKDDKPVN